MPKKRNKDVAKRREAKRHKKAVSRNVQVRTTHGHRRETMPPADLAFEHADVDKLSAVVLEYGHPVIDAAQTVENEKKAIMLSIICWNASLLSPEEAAAKIEAFWAEIAGPEENSARELREVFEAMYVRKRALYGHDRRVVADYAITATGQGLKLEVTYDPTGQTIIGSARDQTELLA